MMAGTPGQARQRHLRWRPVVSLAHRVAGLVLSLWLMLLGATGALLVFKDDWLRWTQPGAASQTLSGTFTATALAARATAAEQAFGAERVRALVLANSAVGLDQVHLRDHAGGGYLDPSTGAVVARWSQGQRVVDVLFDLHHQLLLAEAGKTAVGFIGLLSVALVLSGLVLAAPFARHFSGAVAPRSVRRAALVIAHRELGLVAAAPILVLALTGAALVFPALARSVLRLMLGSLPSAAVLPPHPTSGVAVSWPRTLETALARFPDAEPRVLVWPGQSAVIVVRLRQPAEWHPNGRSSVTLALDGESLEDRDAATVPRADRVIDAVYPVHAAKIGGLAYRIVVAASGLSLAVLSAYGALSYVGLLRRRSLVKRKAGWDTPVEAETSSRTRRR